MHLTQNRNDRRSHAIDRSHALAQDVDQEKSNVSTIDLDHIIQDIIPHIHHPHHITGLLDRDLYTIPHRMTGTMSAANHIINKQVIYDLYLSKSKILVSGQVKIRDYGVHSGGQPYDREG